MMEKFRRPHHLYFFSATPGGGAFPVTSATMRQNVALSTPLCSTSQERYRSTNDLTPPFDWPSVCALILLAISSCCSFETPVRPFFSRRSDTAVVPVCLPK